MGKIAFLFSGQGAQYPGMMKDLSEICNASKSVFDTADRVLERSISQLCFDGKQEDLNITHNTQPCVLASDLAAYAAISENGIKPDMVAGFSLGEYAALVVAEVLRIEDAFSVIQKRADAMQGAVPIGTGAMAAVMGDETQVKELCNNVEGYVEAANYNCPGQIVVAGEMEAVNMLVANAKELKIKAMMLPVSAPFHCKLMKPAAEVLREVLESVEFGIPKYPIYMNVDANSMTTLEGLKKKMILQAQSPVWWEKTLRNMYVDGVRTFVELGPGKTLSGFVNKTFKGIEDVKSYRVSDMETLQETVSALKGRE